MTIGDVLGLRPVASHRQEVTPLTPQEEAQFQSWAAANGITDADMPEGRYDYRGYWLDVASKAADQTKLYADGLHFPDTYKQHGHPSFSVESKYSTGPNDGGNWDGEVYIPQGMRPEAFADALRIQRKASPTIGRVLGIGRPRKPS